MKRVKEDQKERSLLQVLLKMISFPRGDLQEYDLILKYIDLCNLKHQWKTCKYIVAVSVKSMLFMKKEMCSEECLFAK